MAEVDIITALHSVYHSVSHCCCWAQPTCSWSLRCFRRESTNVNIDNRFGALLFISCVWSLTWPTTTTPMAKARLLSSPRTAAAAVAGRLCVKERRAAQQFVVRLAHADWILQFLRHIILSPATPSLECPFRFQFRVVNITITYLTVPAADAAAT